MNIKKIAVGATIAAATFGSLAGPAFADQPSNPGCVGEAVSVQGRAGTRNDVVLGILDGGNLGHAIQAWKGPACGLPAAH